jgi:hypothetical protein
MHKLANNVLGRLKYDITSIATSLVVEPLAGTPPFSLPPAPTAAGSSTYGEPYGILTLMDRLDSSALKIEHVLYSARAAEAGGAFTYTVSVRGHESSLASAWTAGAYVLLVPTADVLARHTSVAVLRALGTIVHARDGVMSWDGTNFGFSQFRVLGIGRGRHFNSTGFFDITMPANGTIVTGHGGHSGATVASSLIPVVADSMLWYEPNIGGANTSIDGNFRLTSWNADFTVPPHWIFLAAHQVVGVAGAGILRVANGATLYPKRTVSGSVGFANSWVAYAGAPTEPAPFYWKDVQGIVHLGGAMQGGTMNAGAFTLPAGFRPGGTVYVKMPNVSNAAFGYTEVQPSGLVVPRAGVNTHFSLEGVHFPAGA